MDDRLNRKHTVIIIYLLLNEKNENSMHVYTMLFTWTKMWLVEGAYPLNHHLTGHLLYYVICVKTVFHGNIFPFDLDSTLHNTYEYDHLSSIYYRYDARPHLLLLILQLTAETSSIANFLTRSLTAILAVVCIYIASIVIINVVPVFLFSYSLTFSLFLSLFLLFPLHLSRILRPLFAPFQFTNILSSANTHVWDVHPIKISPLINTTLPLWNHSNLPFLDSRVSYFTFVNAPLF